MTLSPDQPIPERIIIEDERTLLVILSMLILFRVFLS